MDNRDIFRKAVSVLENEGNVALITVVAAVGSTPGKRGYKMLVFSQSQKTAGTVGGGLIEAKMIDAAAEMLGQSRTRVCRFNLGETPDDEKGICGGSVEYLIESFDRTALPLFRELASETGSRVLISILAPDALPRKLLVAPGSGVSCLRSRKHVPPADSEHVHASASLAPDNPSEVVKADGSSEIVKAIEEIAAAGCGQAKVSDGGVDVFIESLAKPPMVFLFGAGHVASFVSTFVTQVHFSVTVCDDRPEYANAERFPGAESIVVESFERVLAKLPIAADSYLVIVTRGHRWDKVVLEQALRTPAYYIGMIGSRLKTRAILEDLRERGFSQEAFNRVYSPIGLSIGAITAEEIALSTVAELVKIRRLGHGSKGGHMTLPGREAP